MIRPARDTDRAAIAAIQLESWRDAYAGALPETFLQDELPGILDQRWQGALLGPPNITLIAYEDAPLAFASVVDRTPPHLENLHTRPAARSTGIGRRLMADVARRLIERDQEALTLEVLASNGRARAFYARLGGEEGPPFEDSHYGHKVQAVPVLFPDLEALTR
ncbi:MAG: GNAT family N-acetyltransferase [Pseudomonadota bacterium]